MRENDSILDRIESPEDLKDLSCEERIELAECIRERIVDTVSKTGGHLASNLGVVELSIALHSVFNSPKDKIVWDVSHQSYPHKLLTGRNPMFHTLRQKNGLSGFTKLSESPHDAFGAGHASTSISAALGLAKARDASGGDEKVIAVIGDGSMTGGVALEGLNNAEPIKSDIIVVLNDNQMSISENVGAMSVHLSKLRSGKLYQNLETRAREMVERMPHGKTLFRTAEGISHGVTRLLGSEKGVLFEELGFSYLGPVDGHDIDITMEMLRGAVNIGGPVLVHVQTSKGKGYEHAENNARKFHGIPGFQISDGMVERSSGHASYTKAFSESLVELAENDDRIVAITAAMPDGTGLAKFAEKYPDRFFDVGIAEQHAVTFAAGLAAGGMRPVVAMYSTFLQRAYDQIVHDVCLQKLPVVFAIDRAGIVGEDGPTHHGVFDLSYLSHIPDLVIGAPKDTLELRSMLSSACSHDGPYAIRYPRGGGPCEFDMCSLEDVPVGKAEVIRNGDDVAIIALGSTVYPAEAAARKLETEGVSAQVINARFAKPMDLGLFKSVFERGIPVIIVEDNAVRGGFGSNLVSAICEDGCQIGQVKMMGVPDEFIEHGRPDELRKMLGLDAEGIASHVRSMVSVRERDTAKSSI